MSLEPFFRRRPMLPEAADAKTPPARSRLGGVCGLPWRSFRQAYACRARATGRPVSRRDASFRISLPTDRLAVVLVVVALVSVVLVVVMLVRVALVVVVLVSVVLMLVALVLGVLVPRLAAVVLVRVALMRVVLVSVMLMRVALVSVVLVRMMLVVVAFVSVVLVIGHIPETSVSYCLPGRQPFWTVGISGLLRLHCRVAD